MLFKLCVCDKVLPNQALKPSKTNISCMLPGGILCVRSIKARRSRHVSAIALFCTRISNHH